MARTWRADVVAALFSGLLYCAAFPPLDWSPLAFAALIPLLARLRSAGSRRGAALGWITGTVGCTALVGSSIYAACRSYFGLAPWLSVVVAVAIPQVYGVPYFVLFAAVAARLMRGSRAVQREDDGRHCFRNAAAAQKHCPPTSVPAVARDAYRDWGVAAELLGIPAAWVACELARAHIGHGAPWIMLGHSQHAWLSLIQCADFSGVYGVSFLVALVNVGLVCGATALREQRRPARSLMGLASVGAVIGSALLYGRVQMTRWADPPGAGLHVALVQGSTPETWRYSLRHLPDTLQRYRDLTQHVAAAAPDLVIWPENAISVLVSANPDVLRDAAASLPDHGRLLLGAPRAASAGDGALRNAAFLIDHDGTVLGVQDKLRLTPFAEYAPRLAPAFLDPPAIGTGHYSAGDERTLFAVGAARFAVLICYEAIYPDLARERVLDGAQFLVNISNDDWFLQQPAIQQHFIAAQFRAIETRRYLLRATSSGITGIVDPRGAVVAEAPIGEPATLTVAVHPITTLTFHARHGDAFAWLCALLVCAWLVTPRPLPA